MGRNKIHYKCQGRLKKKKKQIKSLKINDKVESSPKILADSFNKFFMTIAENIDKNIIHTNANDKDYLEKFSNQFILFKTSQRGRSQFNHKANENK